MSTLEKLIKELDDWDNPFEYKIDYTYLHGVETWYPTGSFFICSPQVTTTDKDFVVLPSVNMYDLHEQLLSIGYRHSISDADEYDLSADDLMRCYRKDDINLIVVADKELYHKWVDATELAKNMRLNDKEQRIRLFQYVLYGNTELKENKD